MTNYREILRLSSLKLSSREIMKILPHSKTTILDVIKRAKVAGLSIPVPSDVSDDKLKELLYPKEEFVSDRKQPNFEYIHKELKKPNVTLMLLWGEYADVCSVSNEIPYMYSQFCNMYRLYAQKNNLVMRLDKKPGDAIEVDWAGSTCEIYNSVTGEMLNAYVFVASLAMSKYTYVEAFLSMDTDSWITAHVNAFEFFGGCTKTIVPDNLKTGVQRNGKYETIINAAYDDMARHYHTAILPTRVRKPRDKSSVEGEVGVVSNKIIAALRNQKFFTLQELNSAIHEKLGDYNNAPFQKREGGRYSVFMAEEKHLLIPLPEKKYEICDWKVATVGPNYHVSVLKMNYSVPYGYVKQRVTVRFTVNTIEVFYNGQRIASHKRLHGRIGQYLTDEAHMPESHLEYIEWNSGRFIRWAASIGPNTKTVIQGIFDGFKIEQQGYKQCLGILNIAKTHSKSLLETICGKALERTPNPSYKMITIMIKNEIKTNKSLGKSNEEKASGFTRGANYYGGKK